MNYRTINTFFPSITICLSFGIPFIIFLQPDILDIRAGKGLETNCTLTSIEITLDSCNTNFSLCNKHWDVNYLFKNDEQYEFVYAHYENYVLKVGIDMTNYSVGDTISCYYFDSRAVLYRSQFLSTLTIGMLMGTCIGLLLFMIACVIVYSTKDFKKDYVSII